MRHDFIAMVDLIEDRKEELARICLRFGVLSLGLFGSVIREDFHAETSDLDFVVEFAPMSPDEHAHSYFGLLKEIVWSVIHTDLPALRRDVEALLASFGV